MKISASYAAAQKTIDKGQRGEFKQLTNKHVLLAMKLTSILLLIACMQVNAKGFGQGTVTISVKNVAVTEVFKEIEKQTVFRFLYRDELVKKAGLVTVTVKDASVQEVLDQCFSRKPLDYKIFKETIVISEKAAAVLVNKGGGTGMIEPPVPTIDVRGRVVNENGTPVHGVTVTVKGTQTSTVTDEKGEFSLNTVDQEAILIFTHVSMETFEYAVRGRTELSINLKTKISSLGDVTVTVSTGYQQIPKERSTGSFGFINKEEINRKAGVDILSRLEGVTTGIIIDRRQLQATQNSVAPANILIRGVSTLTKDMQSPLVIVDNFPYDGDIANINPNDVENITILKDAAAASIWGARAGNGVIVITTKRGQYNQPFRLSLNSNIQVTSKPDLFANPRMSTSDFIELEEYLFEQGQYDMELVDPSNPPLSPVVEVLELKRQGIITDQAAAEQINLLRAYDVRNDFDNYVYHTGVNNQYSLTLSGGSPKLKYSVSGGFDKAQSTLKGDDFRRITFRSATSFVPLKDFEINVGLAYTNSTARNNSLGNIDNNNYGSRTRALYPYARFADANGNPLPVAKDFRLGYTDSAGAGKLLDWAFRPIQEMQLADNKTRLADVLFNIGVAYRLNSFLSLNANYQFEKSDIENKNLNSVETYFARNLINRFTQIDGETVLNILPKGGILDRNLQTLTSHIGRAQINVNKNWNSIHELNGIFGGEIRDKKVNREGVRYYGFDPNRYSVSSVDYVNAYPLYSGGFMRIPNLAQLFQFTDRFVSIYGNMAYTYKGKYTLSASARRDAANVFGIKSNNRWKPLWTAGAAWNIHKEPFYKSNLLTYLRLRATYGYQGNVNNSISPHTIIGYSPSNNFANYPWAFIVNAANPQLAWESTGQLNLGMDFRIGQRIDGSVEVYRKKSTNLLWDMPIDPTTGVFSVKSNSATMVGKGVEVSLHSINIKGTFQWESELGLSFNSNKVLDYIAIDEDRRTILSTAISNGMNIIGMRGKSPYSIFSFPFAGLDPTTGDPRGFLGKAVSTDYQAIFNQLYDTANLVYHGSALPMYLGYFNQIIKYKGISLIININYRLGYYFKKNTISYFGLVNSGTQHGDYSRRWQNPGDETTTTIPSFAYPVANGDRDLFYANSSANVYKGDHIRLQNIRLAYELSKMKRLPFQSLQVYCNLENIGIIWRANDQKLDPDYDIGNSAFPVPKVFTVGVNLIF